MNNLFFDNKKAPDHSGALGSSFRGLPLGSFPGFGGLPALARDDAAFFGDDLPPIIPIILPTPQEQMGHSWTWARNLSKSQAPSASAIPRAWGSEPQKSLNIASYSSSDGPRPIGPPQKRGMAPERALGCRSIGGKGGFYHCVVATEIPPGAREKSRRCHGGRKFLCRAREFARFRRITPLHALYHVLLLHPAPFVACDDYKYTITYQLGYVKHYFKKNENIFQGVAA